MTHDSVWGQSKRVGSVAEISVFSPIKSGRVPGERRTYEERLRARMQVLQTRLENRLPIAINRVQTLHFGKVMIIRPEHYNARFGPLGLQQMQDGGELQLGAADDPYKETLLKAGEPEASARQTKPPAQEGKSFLHTTVFFDRDIKLYFRDIADFVSEDFDNLLENCDEYPGTANFEQFWQWIRKYQIEVDFFYAAYPDISVARLKYLEYFKDRFDAFVARVRPSDGNAPASIDALFDDFLRETEAMPDGFPYASGIYKSADGEDET